MKLQSTKIIIINVVVTFLEGFGAAWLLTGNKLDQTALVGAGAAGLSAVWNLVVKPVLRERTSLYK